jgi:segregation and condensation protein A
MTPEVDSVTALAEAPRAEIGNRGAPVLRLAAWEGPLDLLLELARAQRVDLARISVADLAAQFAAVLDAALARRAVPLSRLAEWTLMAAWLLRSRLLLPAGTAECAAAEREAARRLAAAPAARARGLRPRPGRAGGGDRARGRPDRTAAGLPQAAGAAATSAGDPPRQLTRPSRTGRRVQQHRIEQQRHLHRRLRRITTELLVGRENGG